MPNEDGLPEGPEEKPEGKKDARHTMDSTLKQVQLELRMVGIDSTLYLHTNRDGSVDAELMAKEPRNRPQWKERTERLNVFEVILEALPKRMPGFWISSGTRFEARRDEDNYFRHKSGMSQAQSFYQRYTDDTKEGGPMNNMPYNLLTGAVVAEKIEKRQRKKVDGVFVRLHWNPWDQQPGRADKRKDRKKKRRRKKVKAESED